MGVRVRFPVVLQINLNLKAMDIYESEVYEDLDKLIAMVKALRMKYGERLGCVLSIGCTIPGNQCGIHTAIVGHPNVVHSVIHGLMERPNFINELFDVLRCIINEKSDKPEFIKELMDSSLISLKQIFVAYTDEFKKYQEEKELDDMVNDFVKDVFKEN